MQNKVNQSVVELQKKLTDLTEETKVSDVIYDTMCHLVFSTNLAVTVSDIEKEFFMLHQLRSIFLEIEKDVS